jgi:hypothetical protein
VVEAGGFVLEALAAGHLETEEGTHGLLGGVGILLALLLLDGLGWGSGHCYLRSSNGGVMSGGCRSGDLLALS